MTAVAPPDLRPQLSSQDHGGPPLQLVVSVQDRYVVVFVHGELDVSTAPALIAQLTLLGKVPVVVLDLESVDFIDCHGLGTIVAARAGRQVRSQELTVRKLSPPAQRLFALTGFANTVSAANRHLDVERWVERCRADTVTATTRPAGLSDELLTAILAAFAQPAAPGSGAQRQAQRLAQRMRAAIPDPSTALAGLGWAAEAFARLVVPDLGSDRQSEAWRALSEILPKTMAAIADDALGCLRAEALTDVLTGLGNRRAFQQRLGEMLADAHRHSRRLCVVMLDVDGLKAINDRLGHHAGDEQLKSLGAALRTQTRAGDGAYRVGGDEFVVLLPDTSTDEAETLLARLSGPGVPTFSVGLAVFPADGTNPVLVADRRLYDTRRQRVGLPVPQRPVGV